MVFFHCFFSKFGFLIIGIVIGILLSNPDILFPNDYQIILDYDTPKVLTYRWPVHSKNLVNSRGYKLETYRWLATNPKGLLFFFNGFGDYCDHYANMVALAVEEGFSCFCMDIEGVGRSEGLRNYIDSFNQTVRDDQIEFVKKVQTEFKSQNLPSFALGASLGGATVLSIVLKEQNIFESIVLFCPAIEIANDLYPILRNVAEVAAKIIPTVGVAPPLLKEKAGKICIDPIVEYAYRFDPLNYLGRIRCQTGVSLMKGLEYLQSQLHNIKIPLLVLHGDEDVLTYLSATQDLMRQVSSKDKTLEILRGEYHDFVHSPKYTEYFSIVSKWLNKRHFQK